MTDFCTRQSNIINKLRLVRKTDPERSVASILKEWRQTAVKKRKDV